jgi:hypothetical protein
MQIIVIPSGARNLLLAKKKKQIPRANSALGMTGLRDSRKVKRRGKSSRSGGHDFSRAKRAEKMPGL